MSGDFRLGLSEDFDKVAHTDLAPLDEVEKAQSCGVGECGEEADEMLRGGRLRHKSNICLDRCNAKEYIWVSKYRGLQ